MVLEHEFAFNVKVTAIARCFSICPDNLALIAHAFYMKAAGAVAGFTTLYLALLSIFVCYVDGYACMISELEIFGFCVVAIGTGFGPDVFGAWN